MRINYGENNAMRVLEEAEFWKRQEGEHTEVIQEILPDLEEEYVDKLNEYKEIFNSTEARIVQYIETLLNCKGSISPSMSQYIMQLIDIATRQSQVFVNFLGKILKDSKAISNNPMAIVVLNHIRRESEYFIGTISAFLDSNCVMDNEQQLLYKNTKPF